MIHHVRQSTLVAIAAIAAGVAYAQSPAESKFEVASIRPCALGGPGAPESETKGGPKALKGGSPQAQSPDTFRMCLPLAMFIRIAYIPPNLSFGDTLQGGPAWITSDSYQINAKASGNPSPEAVRGPMLRALLEERFHLKVRRETRETPGYAITLARGGARMPKVADGACIPVDPANPRPDVPMEKMCGPRPQPQEGPNRKMFIHGYTLAEFAQFITAFTMKPVMDRTGLPARYDFHLEFAPDDTTPGMGPRVAGEPTGGPSLFTAVQEQLGLKLESAKGTREYFVVDHVERPTAN